MERYEFVCGATICVDSRRIVEKEIPLDTYRVLRKLFRKYLGSQDLELCTGFRAWYECRPADMGPTTHLSQTSYLGG